MFLTVFVKKHFFMHLFYLMKVPEKIKLYIKAFFYKCINTPFFFQNVIVFFFYKCKMTKTITLNISFCEELWRIVSEIKSYTSLDFTKNSCLPTEFMSLLCDLKGIYMSHVLMFLM